MTVEHIMRFQCNLKFAERDNFIVVTSEGSKRYDSYHELPEEIKRFIQNSDNEVTVTSTGYITKYVPKKKECIFCDGCYKTDKDEDLIRIQIGREFEEEKTICFLCKKCFKNLLKDMKAFSKKLKEEVNKND